MTSYSLSVETLSRCSVMIPASAGEGSISHCTRRRELRSSERAGACAAAATGPH